MVEAALNLEKLITQVLKYINKCTDEELSYKPNPEKWSKKEILGHLVDSGVNNLKRFTEIQYEEKPYRIESYKQNELVKANDYQSQITTNILNLVVAINMHIAFIFKNQTDESLNYEIINYEDETFKLSFLIQDYVEHFEHHLGQIMR